jgi:iron only hydrogenase large subunit-like protein
VAAILKMAIGRNVSMSGHHYLPTFFMPCFDSHFENGRHFENFENAELLL